MDDSPCHRQFCTEERVTIQIRIRDGLTTRAIARELARAPSSVHEEIARNGGRENYRAEGACARASSVRHRRGLRLDNEPDLATRLVEVLAQKRSPAQAKMILEAQGVRLPSVESIYQWFYRSRVARELGVRELMRRPRLHRRPRTRPVTGKGKIKDPVNISLRPFAPEDRSEYGHWEGDLVLGKKDATALVTLVERKTRFARVIPIASTKAAFVEKVLADVISELGRGNVKTITWDNGKELANHEWITKDTGVPIFFCDPYAPWQRGTNENTNGLLRWQYPKGQTLNLDEEFARAVEEWLNTRPMPTLSGSTPTELFVAEGVRIRC